MRVRVPAILFLTMLGVVIGALVERSNGRQNDILFDESDRTALSGIAGGLIGGVLGDAIGGSVGVWEDRYVFAPAAGEDSP